MTIAIERVRIRYRHVRPGICIAGEICAPYNLCRWKCAWFDDIPVVTAVSRDGAWSAEVGVGIVNPGIDDSDPDAIAGVPTRCHPCVDRVDKRYTRRVFD